MPYQTSFPVDLGFDVLPHLAGKMVAYPITDYLLDIGTLDNYEKAQRTWLGDEPTKETE
jgi:mannose-1-phosphate guanylyltransferase